MIEWYLVKSNWSATERRCPGYAGLGGDIWPLDERASRVHSEVMEKRSFVTMGDYDELVCTDIGLARTYASEAEKVLTGNVIVLCVGLATRGEDPWDGIDFGNPSGGFSLVETNVINEGRGEVLNPRGLFSSVERLEGFFQNFDGELEEGDFVAVRIKVLSGSGPWR